jgi:hypothetical protein
MAFGQPTASFRPYVERAYAALTMFGESGAVRCSGPRGGGRRGWADALAGQGAAFNRSGKKSDDGGYGTVTIAPFWGDCR